jgi:hypothetical protein
MAPATPAATAAAALRGASSSLGPPPPPLLWPATLARTSLAIFHLSIALACLAALAFAALGVRPAIHFPPP